MKKLKLKKHNYPGKLIVFEGVDGSGKSTLVLKAKQILESSQKKCIVVKMPSDRIKNLQVFYDYDNSTKTDLREILNLTNLTVFVTGDRLISLDLDVIPYLKKGYYVLCDRYCFTGYVRCPSKEIFNLCKRFVKPDMAILASANSLTVKERVKSRKNEKENYYDEDDVLKQIKKFDFLAKKHKFKILDTTQNQNVIQKHLMDIISKV